MSQEASNPYQDQSKMSHDPLKVVQGSACRHLRSKGMFITGKLDPADDPAEEIGDGNCWCNKTQNVLGPDDGLVERTDCDSRRSCYESGV